MKKLRLLMMTLLLPVITFAQSDTCSKCKPYPWEVGIPLGVANYYGDVYCSSGAGISKLHSGLFVRRHVSDYIALRGNLLLGALAGDDKNNAGRKLDITRKLAFKTPLTEIALLAELYPLKERKFTCFGECKKTISPYLFGGIGYALTNPTVTQNPGATFPVGQRVLDQDKAALKKASLVIPLGLGAKYNLADQWTLGAEVGFRKVLGDYIDGVSLAAVPPGGTAKNTDWYSLSNVNLSYRFGDKDSDGDKVVDKCDACVNEKGLRQFMGCPDTDGDGVPDKDDACPTVAGLKSLKGCPDADGDGIADKDDLCPAVAGLASLNGCPDKDGDGVADKDDACPDVKGLKSMRGCPDTDGDGITDKEDDCPTVAGLTSLRGCPDRDGDGIADKDDACPDVAGPAALKGCPDSDGDGIADKDDKCPNEKGVASQNGCPEPVAAFVGPVIPSCMNADDYAAFETIANNIEFYKGTNKLKPGSYKEMDRLCKIMQNCPDLMLEIKAYAKNAGSNSQVMKLARLRACAVYGYLIKKRCIQKSRMVYSGDDADLDAEFTTDQPGDTDIDFILR
jgi:OmpA-OmpF porin, OOP family